MFHTINESPKMAKKRTPSVKDQGPAIHEAPPRTKPKFWNEAQERFWDTISANTITICTGPPGTSKTHISVLWAQYALLRGEFSRIIFTRPIVEATESLGWLPGTVEQRTAPFMRPMQEIVKKTKVVDDSVIESIPLAYLRGITFDGCVCVLDEAQNASKDQLRLYLTRLGRHSKMILCGDTEQSDVRDSGLAWAQDRLEGLSGVGTFKFTDADIVRHPLVGQVLDRLRESK